MSTGWKLYWVLVALTLVIYMAMVGWSLPLISNAAGGLAPFDLRPGGYSFDDAQAFLMALPADSVVFYQETQHRLDAAFPALVGVVLIIGLWWLSHNWPTPARILLVAFPLVGAIADYLENSSVARLLIAGGEGITPDMVAQANRWTVLKSGSITVSMLALLGFLLVALAKALKNRGDTK